MSGGGRSRVSGWVRAVPILAAFAVGAASFTLSFFAQSEVAAQLGAVPERLAWLVPVTIDGGILAGSASLWASSTRGSRKDPVAYLTIVALLALSVVINVRHASGTGEVLASVIAGTPPVILLLCLELVAAQARRDAVDQQAEAQEKARARAAADPGPAPQPATRPALTVSSVSPVHQGPAPASQPAGRPAYPVPSSSSATTTPVGPARTVSPVGRAPVGQPSPAGPVGEAEQVPGAVAGPAVSPREPGEVGASQAPVKPTVQGGARRSGSVTQRVRALFAEHVAAGGDPRDRDLVGRIATELDAPVPSVRRVVSEARKELEAAAAA